MTDDDRKTTDTPQKPVEQEESGAGYGNNAGQQGVEPEAEKTAED